MKTKLAEIRSTTGIFVPFYSNLQFLSRKTPRRDARSRMKEVKVIFRNSRPTYVVTIAIETGIHMVIETT